MTRVLVATIVAASIFILPGPVVAAPAVVCLHSREPDGPAASLLVREIARQAILISARDELGLLTRDETLREPLIQPAAGEPPVLDIATAFEPGKSLKITLLKSLAADKTEPLWEHTYTLTGANGETGIAELVTTIQSAIAGDMRKALLDAGFKPSEKPKADPTTAPASPADIEASLRDLTFFSQFALLQQLHDQMRRGDSSPETIGYLVRAYANLGQLTQFQWRATHEVFKARALLYAQRMVAADPKSAAALWHRAYARTLIGLHAPALADLASAEALQKSAAKPADAPTWVLLLGPRCQYDIGQLAILAQNHEELTNLSTFLCFTAVENENSVAAIIGLAKAALIPNPQCVRLINGMCTAAGVSYLHQLTMMFPEVFRTSLAEHLPKMPGLPKNVGDAITAAVAKNWKVPKARADLATALVAAGDPAISSAEPSWDVLGRMVEDTFIVHVQRRINFLEYEWGVGQRDVLAFNNAAMDLIGKHPDAPIIRSYGYRGGVAQCMKILNGYEPRDLGLGVAAPIVNHFNLSNDAVYQQFGWPMFEQIRRHLDDTSNDLERYAMLFQPPQGPDDEASRTVMNNVIQRLALISPNSPRVIVYQIDNEWDKHAKDADRWERTLGDDPSVAMALGSKYCELHRFDDAERLFKKYVTKSPDLGGYSALAQTYLDRGDEEQWLATLESYLTNIEDYGLDHANTQVQIAHHFMAKGEYEKAQPYADAAAESWAAWAMQCAAQVHEALHDWAGAEQWIQRTSERYDNSGADWYIFCRRTGHGNVEGAKAMADAYVRRYAGGDAMSSCRFRGYMQLLEGDNKAAAAEFERSIEKNNDVYAALQIAASAAAAGDTAGRDKALHAAVDAAAKARKVNGAKAPRVWPNEDLAKFLTEQFAHSATGPIDVAGLEKIIRESTPETGVDVQYFAGRFLDSTGQKQNARRILIECAKSDQSNKMTRILACVALRERGLEPPDFADPATKPAEKPADKAAAKPAK